MKPTRRQLEYVYGDEIIPKDWTSWFWGALSESSTVTFGDNDHSMISAERFLSEIQDIFDSDHELSESIPTETKEQVFQILNELESAQFLISI